MLKNTKSGQLSKVKHTAISSYSTKTAEHSYSRGRATILRQHGVRIADRWLYAEDGQRAKIMMAPFWDKSTYYVRVKSFATKTSLAKLIDGRMRELLKANPKRVIIDLTSNRGGKIEEAQRFLSYFLTSSSRLGTLWRTKVSRPISDSKYDWFYEGSRKYFTSGIKKYRFGKKRNGVYQSRQRPKSFGNPSYKGELIVLVNPKTFSAATFVATTLKRLAGAKIVGDIGDTSMRTSCLSSPGAHYLKHSKVGILIPLTCFTRSPKAATTGNLKGADVPVDLSLDESRRAGKNILRAAIGQIFKKEKQPSKPTKVAIQKIENVLKPKTVVARLAERRDGLKFGWLGVRYWYSKDLDLFFPAYKAKNSVVITNVETGSPAEQAGLKIGNVISTANGRHIYSTSAFTHGIRRYDAGDEVSLGVTQLAKTPREFFSALEKSYHSGKHPGEASFILGSMYAQANYKKGLSDKELGASQDITKAPTDNSALFFEWMHKAAKEAHSTAILDLAILFDMGGQNWNKPKTAAIYAVHALKLDGINALKNLSSRRVPWQMSARRPPMLKEMRLEIQKIVTGLGFYDGPMDGRIFFPEFKQAIKELHQARKVQLPDLPGDEILELTKHPLVFRNFINSR